ncbi:cilia- and flagella-associated protein 70-like [Osmia bicornis bicornis]|uniref:cilia- and flagella-associated protein 70-like n=1 Tax=Osmia bicornis bicornis TaxID=1437191 RepID=UPI001EAE8836|nr:cilia- and flagella-associated protein 70-like [Osmia bicornis bicornis]
MEKEQNLSEGKNIEITIDTIQNVIKKTNVSVSFIVEHNGTILGNSGPTFISANCEDVVYGVDFVVSLPVSTKDKQNLNSIVSTPVLIKAMQNVDSEHDEKSIGSEKGTKKKSVFTSKSISTGGSAMLGICNFDLLPIILGEKCYTEKLLLETPKFFMDEALVSWQNLPLLTVTASQNNVPFFQPEESVNFLNITVESIYNLPQTFTENLQYKVGTIAYIDNEIPENIIFENGLWTKFHDVERTKRWNSLRFLENRAQLSKYKLDCDFMGVKNEFKKWFNLTDKIYEDLPRIEWNSLERFITWTAGTEAMKNHIIKYRYWPFQIMITEKGVPSKLSTLLYQCYIDLSELLFSGRKSCRVVGQLYSYNPMDISEKVGLEKNIFDLEKGPKESKEREKKSKASKHSPSETAETVFEPSVELISENAEPTVIVIEVELYKPLFVSNVIEDFQRIYDMISKPEKRTRYVYTSELAEKQFMNCIQKLTEYITECYRDFREENEQSEESKEKYCFDPREDELACFTQHLYKTGQYLAIRNTLRSKVPLLLDQKFNMPRNFVDSNETQNFIASIYSYLVEQMHIALNKIVENRFTEDLDRSVDSKLMYFYAEEAYELGELDRARYYYTTVIASNKSDPHSWTKYSMFLKKIGDVERAKECCLEAISLDRHHPIGLLMYALLLFENREYKEAETFLRALTNFYPRFFECWASLYIFYIRTEYYPGIDLTLRIAEKCIKDKTKQIILDQESLSWTMVHCPQDNVCILIATFLLKLHFCEFAGIALAQAMSNSNQSTSVLYYIAVEHYLSGRFEDALSHLKEAECNYGIDFSISSLMGHCYLKLGDDEKAVEYYDFACMLFDRPRMAHLVEIRLGYHHYNVNEFDRAKRLFLNTCKTSPTLHTWLGVGMSCYELGHFEEAEVALMEANIIDNCNADTWGYLCLLNMTLERYDEFSQCYAEMIKNNLKNKKLWLRITNLMKALDYTPPDLATGTNDFITSQNEEESQEQFEQ